ncbi:diguanylate cyclase domain-containing protein [Qipengyuania sp. SM2507]
MAISPNPMTWIERHVPGGKKLALLGLAFFAITSLTIAMTRFGGALALVWLGTAILAAVLVTLPRSQWPRILWSFAALSAVATSLFGFGPHMALQLAAANVFEGYVIARLLLALRPQRDWLESVDGLIVLIVAGGLVGPALAAIPGGLIVALTTPGSWLSHATDWIAGHGLGTLLGFPIAYMAASGALSKDFASASLPVILECIGHALIVGLVTAMVFLQADLPLLFVPIVPLLFASFRRGRIGASIGLFTIAVIAIAALSTGEGFSLPVLDSFGDKVLFLQFYLAVLLLLALPVSVALKHRHLLFVELEEEKALNGLISDHSDGALLNLDSEGRIRFASPASEWLSGQVELTGEPLAIFFDPLDESLVLSTLTNAGDEPGKTSVIERPVLRGDEQIWLEARIRAVPRAETPGRIAGYAVTIRDATASKHAELRALREADTDALTGLPNRRAFLRHLEARLEYAVNRPFMFAIVDLDHFKCVNDTYGHDAGDMVLRQVAAAMQQLSAPDRFFARLGGDEFALIAERIEPDEATALCEELCRAVAALDLAAPDGTAISLTASVGLAGIDAPCSASLALQAADGPLYAAKSVGGNRVEIATANGQSPNRRSDSETQAA